MNFKKCGINIDIYSAPNEKIRYTLGTKGSNPLIAIGINPSKADREQSDNTVNKVIGLASKYGYDSWIMLNIYPQRATNPSNLDVKMDKKLHLENVKAITELLGKYKNSHLLAAWGGLIESRPYFKQCLVDISEEVKPHKVKWLMIGEELTKGGHPRHPSRAGYIGLGKFDIEKYIK